jgi:glyceraldehyde 3-phosphate dehydrogenase
MTIKIGINGLGRIGRSVLRAWLEYQRNDVEIVALNAPGDTATHLHLLRYDSVHGRAPYNIEKVENGLMLGDRFIRVVAERDPTCLDWAALGVDLVFECSGKFTKRSDAAVHIAQGARKVMVSAPSDGADATIVYGVNNAMLSSYHEVISVGSCTTNCLAPIAMVLDQALGIEYGFMTTVHAYTNDQNILDGTHKDLRRARAAAMSMVPTSTGAAKAIGLVLPQLTGKLAGSAVRVPTPNVSMVDFVFHAARLTNKEEVNQFFIEASATDTLCGILAVERDPLVSIDFTHQPYSSIVDLKETHVVGDRLVRVVSWYDNEWGFSVRMLDLAAYWAKVMGL